LIYTPLWGIFQEVEHRVTIRKSALKQLSKLPLEIQQKFDILMVVLRAGGPTAPHNWTNYGKLKGSKNKYHCHLARSHGFVACWEYQKDVITVEVYYVGSHKDAPY
jgi:mRNA-degrading endonuclease RelE of RelBE toxin-antitoxin system